MHEKELVVVVATVVIILLIFCLVCKYVNKSKTCKKCNKDEVHIDTDVQPELGTVMQLCMTGAIQKQDLADMVSDMILVGKDKMCSLPLREWYPTLTDDQVKMLPEGYKKLHDDIEMYIIQMGMICGISNSMLKQIVRNYYQRFVSGRKDMVRLKPEPVGKMLKDFSNSKDSLSDDSLLTESGVDNTVRSIA